VSTSKAGRRPPIRRRRFIANIIAILRRQSFADVQSVFGGSEGEGITRIMEGSEGGAEYLTAFGLNDNKWCGCM